MKLSQIEKCCKALRLGPDQPFAKLCTDTRTLSSQDLFVALKGPHFDGHSFISQALDRGASGVVVSDPSCVPKGQSALVVDDTYEALRQIGSTIRSAYQIPCIGITGSCGKTTVKTIVGAFLNALYPTLVTQGNLNNHIGVPLMLSRLDAQHQAMVIEMGANGLKEISQLAQMARPTIALVNNVYPVHLEGFGSLEGIVQTKSEIYEALDDKGTAVLNLDSPYVKAFKARIGGRKTITFGRHSEAMIKAEDVIIEKTRSHFTLVTPTGSYPIALNLPGEHYVMNALAAISCVYPLEVPMTLIQSVLADFEAVEGRTKIYPMPHGGHLIDESYNANPQAVYEAIKVLSQFDGPRMLVLGDMGELGEKAPYFHEQIGEKAKSQSIEALWAVGPLSQKAVTGFGEKGRWFESKEALLTELKALDKPFTVLIKGSNSVGMGTLVQQLLNNKEA